jgi:hypothetical protein
MKIYELYYELFGRKIVKDQNQRIPFELSS